jgi:TolB-like protein
VTELEAAGLPVWLDVHKLKPGVVWDTEVELALRGTDVLLVILSENSGASTNVLDEINFALSKNRLVVPVLYQSCEIPYRLARLQHIDFTTGPREVALHRLVERLRAATTPGGSAPFAAAPAPTVHPPVPAEKRETAPMPTSAPAPSTISPSVPVPMAADARAPRGPWRGRRLVSNLAFALFIVAAFVAWYRYSSVTAGTKRLAVLPFENLGAATDEYFADGMTDEVRGKLASLDDLQVTARSSAMQYKKTAGKTPEQIGRELGVDFLLTGTVRWQGTGGTRRVRVSPELIRVSDGTSRWQQPFDTEMNDVFQVQADIASRVAQALDVALGATTKQQLSERPTANLAAYDAFLRGE